MRGNPWVKLTMDTWSLGMEASSVIGLRTLKMAAGGQAAQTEAALMINEKIASTLDLQIRAMTGGMGITPHGAVSKTVTHYRRKVRANRRRLSKI